MLGEEIEQTLFVCREVNVFRIPPRVGAGSCKSGDWRLSDKIFNGRLRVISRGEFCEVKLEDPSNGQLFAACPIERGQRHIAVESASDSSRNFVLRLYDPGSKRHAFVGLSFLDRGEAFDFNVALADHEKHSDREKVIEKVVSGSDVKSNHDVDTVADAQLLYKKQDLSLKQGETIKINVKKTGQTGGSGFLSRVGTTASNDSPGLKLAPPPLAPPPLQRNLQAQGWSTAPASTAPQVSASAFCTAAPTTSDPMADLFGELSASTPVEQDPFAVPDPFAQQPATAAPTTTAAQQSVVGFSNWAKFD